MKSSWGNNYYSNIIDIKLNKWTQIFNKLNSFLNKSKSSLHLCLKCLLFVFQLWQHLQDKICSIFVIRIYSCDLLSEKNYIYVASFSLHFITVHSSQSKILHWIICSFFLRKKKLLFLPYFGSTNSFCLKVF